MEQRIACTLLDPSTVVLLCVLNKKKGVYDSFIIIIQHRKIRKEFPLCSQTTNHLPAPAKKNTLDGSDFLYPLFFLSKLFSQLD